MPDPNAEPPALPPEPTTGPGTVILSTSLLGDLQVPGTPGQAATLQALRSMLSAPATKAPATPTILPSRPMRADAPASAGLRSAPKTVLKYYVHATDRLSLSNRETLNGLLRSRAVSLGVGRHGFLENGFAA